MLDVLDAGHLADPGWEEAVSEMRTGRGCALDVRMHAENGRADVDCSQTDFGDKGADCAA